MQNVNFAELTGIERILNVLLRKKKKKTKEQSRKKSQEKSIPPLVSSLHFFFFQLEKNTGKRYGLHEHLPLYSF